MKLLKTMIYFRCLPPIESYQLQLILVRSFQTASGTNGKITNGTIGKTPKARYIKEEFAGTKLVVVEMVFNQMYILVGIVIWNFNISFAVCTYNYTYVTYRTYTFKYILNRASHEKAEIRIYFNSHFSLTKTFENHQTNCSK